MHTLPRALEDDHGGWEKVDCSFADACVAVGPLCNPSLPPSFLPSFPKSGAPPSEREEAYHTVPLKLTAATDSHLDGMLPNRCTLLRST